MNDKVEKPSFTKLIERSRQCAMAARLDEALVLAEAARNAAPPNDILADTHLGWILDRRREHSRAQATYRSILARDGSSRIVRNLLADSLIAQRDFDEALRVLAPLLPSNEGSQSAALCDVARKVALCLLELGRADAAKAEVQRHLQSDPGHLGLLDIYRRLLYREGRQAEAAEAYLRGAETRGDQVNHIATAIDILVENALLARAIAVGERAVAAGQRGDRLFRSLINAHQVAGQHAEALTLARLALETQPDGHHYWRVILLSSVRLNEVEGAAEAALRALEGGSPYMGAEIEWVVERLKRDRERARDFVARLLELRPMEPWVAILGPRVGLRFDERFRRRSMEQYSIEIAGADSCWNYMSSALFGLQHRGYEGERSRPPERPINLFYVRDVRLCILPHGFFVISSSGDPYEHFAPHLHDAMIDHAGSMVPSGKIEKLFYIGDRHAPLNYAHWTLDYLPRAAVADSFAPDFLIGIPHLRAGSFHRETLEELRIGPDKYIPLAQGVYEVDHLMFLNASSQESSHAFHGGNRYYASIMLSRPLRPEAAAGSRIFLDRAPGSTRQIVNRKDVVEVLDEFGVQAIDPGTLRPQEQISLVRNADVIIGPHGAGLANIAYCRPGTRVLELWHPVLGNPAFVKAAFVAGARYGYMLASPAPPGAEANANPVLANYVIDCVALRLWMKENL